MACECFESKKFTAEHEYVIGQTLRICRSMQAQGYSLTLRQIYYQFIGHDLFPDTWAYRLPDGSYTKNNDKNYKKLGKILSAARRAGLVDWDSFGDRTRNFGSRATAIDVVDVTNPSEWLIFDPKD